MPANADLRSPAGRVTWLSSPAHHRWLQGEEDRLLSFHERHALDSAVGFAPVDRSGRPDEHGPRELYLTARMVHCFSIAHVLGRPGAQTIAEHGIAALSGPFLDRTHGGWFHRLEASGRPLDPTKSAYGHAFVLLAAASAVIAGLPGAEALFAQAVGVVDDHFWRDDEGAAVESLCADRPHGEPAVRGEDANMHLVEALLTAFEATGEDRFRRRAESIAGILIHRHAAAHDWRVPEYYDARWSAEPRYNADKPDDPFRPYGTLPGHSMEWARLLIQLASLPGSRVPWAVEAAGSLFAAAIRDGWREPEGGLPYTVDFEGSVVNPDRMHWAMAECVGAAAFLAKATGEVQYETWYRRFWSYICRRIIDLDGGSWWHQVGESGAPTFGTWPGKPDLYHAYQATLLPRAPLESGLALAARTGRLA